MKSIGLISDTHGLMRPEALRALEGSDLIIHAGDVGRPEILEALQSIAPTFAIRGNIDRGPWAEELPSTTIVFSGTSRLYVLHDLNTLEFDPITAGFRAVISGHSHQPASSERSGVLYVNPGAAGPRRFKLPVTVARLNVRRTPWKVEFIDLLAASGDASREPRAPF